MSIVVGGNELGGVSKILLSGPLRQRETTAACGELLAPRGEPTSLLGVTYGNSGHSLCDAFESTTGAQPTDATVVRVDDESPRQTETGDGTAIRTVGPPDDLVTVAVTVNECLGSWQERADHDERLAVCFDSVTALLRHVREERAFRFLHAFTRRVDQVGGVGHFHVDSAVDETTLETFTPLFDATVEVIPDGGVDVRR